MSAHTSCYWPLTNCLLRIIKWGRFLHLSDLNSKSFTVVQMRNHYSGCLTKTNLSLKVYIRAINMVIWFVNLVWLWVYEVTEKRDVNTIYHFWLWGILCLSMSFPTTGAGIVLLPVRTVTTSDWLMWDRTEREKRSERGGGWCPAHRSSTGTSTQLTANAIKVGEMRKNTAFGDFPPRNTSNELRFKSPKRALTCQLVLVVLQKV